MSVVATPPATHIDRLALVLRTPDGCDLHPSCLRCPRPTCIFDEERPKRSPAQVHLMVDRRSEVERLTEAGISASRIARTLGIGIATVYRARRTARLEAA